MTEKLDGARMLIYSHDSFGLGHLRRCQLIAHSLVEQYSGLSILILSGSPIIGSFDFRARVDFVRIPGVIKLYSGEYTSLSLHIDIQQTLAIRASIIRHTAEVFKPDLFLVDKEPLGLRGELDDTLKFLKNAGDTRLVLGLRDVMDEPKLLRQEWESRNLLPTLDAIYDDIWVYGHEAVWDPLTTLPLTSGIKSKMSYTGYLKRPLPTQVKRKPDSLIDEPYLLVTAGGGGDGYDLFDWVLRAYESGAELELTPLFVLGPFMKVEQQQSLINRMEKIPGARYETFENHFEFLMSGAAAVVSMGGYNSFCEILSFDKRAVIVPRIFPRQEQLVRARESERLGFTKMLNPEQIEDTDIMVKTLKELPHQPKPSDTYCPGLLDGLDTIVDLAGPHLRSVQDREIAPTLA